MNEVTATKIVGDLPESLVSYEKGVIASKLKARTAKPDSTYRGGDVYILGTSDDGYVVLTHEDKVVYFVHYQRVKLPKFTSGRQVLLWRDPSSGQVSDGFAQKIFFDFLLPQYGVLVADTEQTRRGATFWSNAMVRALSSAALHVYLYDGRGSKPKLTALKSEEDISANAKSLWGESEDHLRTFAVISRMPLTLS